MRYQRFWIVVILIVVSLMLVACDSGDGEDIILPTRVDAGGDETQGEDVPVEEASAMPETGTTPQPQPTNTRSSSLPPSWTPTIAPTLTETPMPTPTPEVVDVVPPTIPPGCATFRPDSANSTQEFNLGESPTISWTPAEGAIRYRIRITNDAGFEVTPDAPVVVETTTTLNAELFTEPGRYGWTVEPLDVNGIQMCLGLGDSFFANG